MLVLYVCNVDVRGRTPLRTPRIDWDDPPPRPAPSGSAAARPAEREGRRPLAVPRIDWTDRR